MTQFSKSTYKSSGADAISRPLTISTKKLLIFKSNPQTENHSIQKFKHFFPLK
jgi:hypothetical protein